MTEYERIKREEWAELVRLTRNPPEEMRLPIHKVRAIEFAHESGQSWEEITSAGQSATLKAWSAARRGAQEKRKRLTWMVSASLAESIMSDTASPDAEEPLMTRFYRLGLRTSEDAWLFIHSWFALESDEVLLHHMAEFVPKRFKKVGVKK